jgi:hypothetical protein
MLTFQAMSYDARVADQEHLIISDALASGVLDNLV